MKFILPILLAFAVPASAFPVHAMESTDLRISRQSDLTLNCSAISREVSAMEDLIREARETQNSSEMTNRGVGVAKTVASYMVGSLGGALGIMAAGYIVAEATDDRGEDASAIEELAQQRRSFMVGVYNARACMGPLELASIEPAAGEDDSADMERPPAKPRYHYND